MQEAIFQTNKLICTNVSFVKATRKQTKTMSPKTDGTMNLFSFSTTHQQ